MLHQPEEVGFFLPLIQDQRKEIILLAASTDNPKGEELAYWTNETQEDGSIFT
jgi:hypothetical protein